MRSRYGSAYDSNPSRLRLLVNRNKKTSTRKTVVYSATFFSTLFLGVALVTNLIFV